jgi:hypothetical protein
VLDVAHKVVGVGSVDTRDYVVLLQGNREGDHLFLQIKEALPSVVREPTLRDLCHLGERIVDGQRRIQSVSDPFLGWTSVRSRPSYVRQLRDMKGGVPPDQLTAGALVDWRRSAERSSGRHMRERATRSRSPATAATATDSTRRSSDSRGATPIRSNETTRRS